MSSVNPFHIAVMAGTTSQHTFTEDQTDLDLHAFFGSPAQAQAVSIIVDACDIRTLTIGAWANGTVISIELINSARIMGRGGAGGKGGNTVAYGLDENQGFPGSDGSAAGDAIAALTGAYTLNIDADDGYIWGGGGGGGGGGGHSGSDGGGNFCAGGGGGGGQGWNTSDGGDPGDNSGGPAAGGESGGFGTEFSNGTGGNAGRTSSFPSDPNGTGGDGGTWGVAGDDGEEAHAPGVLGSTIFAGGAGGAAGQAINAPSCTINFTGALNEAGLISAGRLLGAVTP